jgi:dTDP-4-dehydrorhamnose 3,5-epimerase
MKFTETNLKGNYLIDLNSIEDDRGFFARLFCKKEFTNYGLNVHWFQVNNSLCYDTGILRGLHFQRAPNSEVKLVRCIKGSIWDVVVDLRKNSSTYGEWFGAPLTEKNRTMMYVPIGFAHGYISLELNSEILYMVSEYYAPNNEETLIWDDPDVAIKWPMKPTLVSEKDKKGKVLKEILAIDP